MNLLQRYRKLTFWHKVGFWGAICSIISLGLWFIPPSCQPDNSSINQTMNKSPGGIQATGDVNITELSEPNIEITRITKEMIPEGCNATDKSTGVNDSIFKCIIPPGYSGNIIIEVNADTITDFNVEKLGPIMSGNAGTRDGVRFIEMLNIAGTFYVVVKTAIDEPVSKNVRFI